MVTAGCTWEGKLWPNNGCWNGSLSRCIGTHPHKAITHTHKCSRIFKPEKTSTYIHLDASMVHFCQHELHLVAVVLGGALAWHTTCGGVTVGGRHVDARVLRPSTSSSSVFFAIKRFLLSEAMRGFSGCGEWRGICGPQSHLHEDYILLPRGWWSRRICVKRRRSNMDAPLCYLIMSVVVFRLDY